MDQRYTMANETKAPQRPEKRDSRNQGFCSSQGLRVFIQSSNPGMAILIKMYMPAPTMYPKMAMKAKAAFLPIF
ncbi:MAG: hypothetical protein GTN76_09715 [Candidatus Aenigmarchaeota archaeon]|nr:hypothetical protein [Candidatus Aenigmarchaeota archaeon]